MTFLFTFAVAEAAFKQQLRAHLAAASDDQRADGTQDGVD
jgi:hypothetical protein